MATTTNFGWETPDDTDLVKDGALAIRTLGSAIDTSLVDLKGGTTGQVLSKTSNTDMDFTWVTSDDANAIQNTIVDAKGDLISASAADVPARLAVGGNFAFLQADSAQSTGLKWNLDAWTSWTPTVTSGSGTITSYTVPLAKYTRIGKTCIAKFQINITNAGTGASNLEVTLPFSATSDGIDIAIGVFRENNNTGKMGQIRVFSTTSIDKALCLFYDNTTPIATNNRVAGTVVYEVA